MRIEVKDVCKNFGKDSLLEHIHLTFEGGKIYGLVGTNGSGKTVLLKIITGLLRPTSGQVMLDDLMIGKDVKVLPNCGVIIDRPYFFDELYGFENLKILAKIQNKIDDKRILEVLELVKLKHDKKPLVNTP